MPNFDVDGLEFEFPEGWQVGKYDEWAFYRKQFSRMRNDIKAIDLLAVDADRNTWLIEVKDYRRNPRTKPSDLADEVAQKVFDTLAALLPARANANNTMERDLARAATGCERLRVVLHLEQPAKHTRLRPRAIDPANVQKKLKQLLKPVDAHPLVLEMGRTGGMAWGVADR